MDSFSTQCQQVEIFAEQTFFAQRVIKAPCPDNVLPISRFPSLSKKASRPVTQFDREFF